MGGVRQQFTTAAEVRLARASVRLFDELGAPLFEQVGYLFLATTERGLAELEERRSCRRRSGCPSRASTRLSSRACGSDDVLGATICREDGIADPAGVTRELVRRAAGSASTSRARPTRSSSTRTSLVIACGAASRAFAAGARRRPAYPAARAAARGRRPGRRPSGRPADDDRGERLSLPPRRRRRTAARDGEPELRWDGPAEVRDDLVEDWRSGSRIAYPPAAGAPLRARGPASTT